MIVENQTQHGRAGDDQLSRQFGPGGNPLVLMMPQLGHVVPEADSAKPHKDQQRLPDIGIGQIRPQQDAHAQREHDQQAAHGGRAGLGGMRGDIFQNVLAALEAAQPGNEMRPAHNGQHQRRHQRRHGTKGDVAKDVEQGNIRRQRRQQIIKHAYSLPCAQTAKDAASVSR